MQIKVSYNQVNSLSDNRVLELRGDTTCMFPVPHCKAFPKSHPHFAAQEAIEQAQNSGDVVKHQSRVGSCEIASKDSVGSRAVREEG